MYIILAYITYFLLLLLCGAKIVKNYFNSKRKLKELLKITKKF